MERTPNNDHLAKITGRGVNDNKLLQCSMIKPQRIMEEFACLLLLAFGEKLMLLKDDILWRPSGQFELNTLDSKYVREEKCDQRFKLSSESQSEMLTMLTWGR